MQITEMEAHFLLFALDAYCEATPDGLLTVSKHGYDIKKLRALRDRLFEAHEHPPDGC